jgi:hypothetical protein
VAVTNIVEALVNPLVEPLVEITLQPQVTIAQEDMLIFLEPLKNVRVIPNAVTMNRHRRQPQHLHQHRLPLRRPQLVVLLLTMKCAEDSVCLLVEPREEVIYLMLENLVLLLA